MDVAAEPCQTIYGLIAVDKKFFYGLLNYIQPATGWLNFMFRKIQSVISKAGKNQTPEAEAAVNADDSAALEMRIKAIMARVFKIDINEINEGTTSDTIDQWTSLEHVDFLVKLQQEFEIEFTDSQIVEMLSYPAVVENVNAALAGDST